MVGTNGKTSTATFLARLLQAGGLHVGLTVSPHLRSWSERVLVDGAEVDEGELADRVEALADAAAGLDVRFFDLLTFAAAAIFAERRVDVGVFEAGIGGRLDTTRALRPQLVVLTGIGLDHTELLGPDELSILREKLGVAPPGAVVVCCAARGPSSRRKPNALPPQEAFGSSSRRSWARPSSSGTRRLPARPPRTSSTLPTPSSRRSSGRKQRILVEGVEVVLDAAHNADAWRTLAAELPPSYVAVVSVSLDKPPAELQVALAGAIATIATSAWPGRSVAAPQSSRPWSAARRSTTPGPPRGRPPAGRAEQACRSRSSGRPIC